MVGELGGATGSFGSGEFGGALVLDLVVTSFETGLWRDVADGAVEAHFVVVRDIASHEAAGFRLGGGAGRAQALGFGGAEPALHLAVGLRIVGTGAHVGHASGADELFEVFADIRCNNDFFGLDFVEESVHVAGLEGRGLVDQFVQQNAETPNVDFVILRLTFDDLMGYAERGEPIPMEKRALYAYNSSTVVRRLADLADEMMQLLGGRAIYTTSPIIQPWLDLNAGRAHVANDPSNRTGDVLGTMLGEQPGFMFL